LIVNHSDRPSITTKPENVASNQALTVCNSSFIGRDRVLTELDGLFVQNRLILIYGQGGLGKSTVAKFYCQRFESKDFYKLGTVGSSDIANAESLVDKWLQEFFGEEISRQEFSIKLARFRKHLQDDDRNICFVLDNLEPALVNGRFKEENTRYVALLDVLSDPHVRSITLITSREKIHENGIRVYNYQLPELDARSWYDYFQSRQIRVSEQSLEDLSSVLNLMCKAYGGNAECMSVLSGDILSAREYDNSLEDYWAANQEDLLAHPTIEGLIKRQFEVLQRDNQLAYKLLCRMGCYRYQDAVATVPEDGIIAMLWEELKPRAKRIVKDLRDRCLIKFSDQDKGYFLHPVMRAEAVGRLKDECGKWTKEGEEANIQAAQFWTNSVLSVVTIDDALRAFESYHHYVTTSKYELAANVIAGRRENTWDKDEALGNSLYRFGLLESIKTAINAISHDLSNSPNLCKLYNVLGDVYWITGESYKAISLHEKSKKLAIDFDIKNFELVAFLNIGLCQIDVWEIQLAIDSFEKCIELSQNTIYRYHAVDSFFCLSFLNSLLGDKEKTVDFANKFFQELNLSEHNTWATGYRWLFLGKAYSNLFDIDKSLEMYKNAFAYAEKSHYYQVKANALNGLAIVSRIQNVWDQAISYHSESLDILQTIGAKCDLAEAYFQLGLTCQAMGENDQAKTYKAKALELFGQMEAPKQIERVNQAFEQGAQQ